MGWCINRIRKKSNIEAETIGETSSLRQNSVNLKCITGTCGTVGCVEIHCCLLIDQSYGSWKILSLYAISVNAPMISSFGNAGYAIRSVEAEGFIDPHMAGSRKRSLYRRFIRKTNKKKLLPYHISLLEQFKRISHTKRRFLAQNILKTGTIIQLRQAICPFERMQIHK